MNIRLLRDNIVPLVFIPLQGIANLKIYAYIILYSKTDTQTWRYEHTLYINDRIAYLGIEIRRDFCLGKIDAKISKHRNSSTRSEIIKLVILYTHTGTQEYVLVKLVTM